MGRQPWDEMPPKTTKTVICHPSPRAGAPGGSRRSGRSDPRSRRHHATNVGSARSTGPASGKPSALANEAWKLNRCAGHMHHRVSQLPRRGHFFGAQSPKKPRNLPPEGSESAHHHFIIVTRLPVLSGRSIVKALTKVGYVEVRQRGSHIRLAQAGKKSLTVPDHKAVGRGLLRKLLREPSCPRRTL
jgi:predicted RNA binding protein YcfA (HicA-like mRNA interferase family)